MWSYSDNEIKRQATSKDCPLVWDTGALFGLTPFRGDFLDYVEWNISVRDIARENIDSLALEQHYTSSKLMEKTIFLPYLSYHLPSTEVRLFCPQTYHTLYGGHRAVFGDKVDLFIDHLRIMVDIDRDALMFL
jgi:hypothetical protein